MSPELHAALLRGASILLLVMSAVVLTRHPTAAPGRTHALYGLTTSWWLFAMSMVAAAPSSSDALYWSRFAVVAVGMLPGVVYHLNAETAGVADDRRPWIHAYYGLSVAITTFAVASPALLSQPLRYRWGFSPQFSAWGLLPLALLLVVFVEALRIFRQVMDRTVPGSAHHRRARVFYLGNYVAYLSAADFLSVFGIGVYPFGFAIVTVMFTGVVLGSLRYRLIDVTPEIAAGSLLETMPDAVLVVDRHGVVRLANQSATRLLAGSEQPLVERPLASVTGDVGLVTAFATPERTPPGAELRFVAGDGRPRSVALFTTRLDDSWGEVLAWVWLLRDLTDQRRAEDEKRTLEGWIRQSQRMESLGVLAGGIAHDFNNILTTIIGSVEVARPKIATAASVGTDLDRIATAAEHAAELTGQLLAYAGRTTPHDTAIDLGDLLRDMADLLRSAASRRVTVVARLAASLPACRGDRGQLRQVLLNLVTNASEAIGEHPGTIRISTGVVVNSGDAPGDQLVFVDVADDGPGMSEDTLERLFDPFFTTKFEGRGLGLAIVQRIVHRHGGRIAVRSTLGAGTTFHIELPALDHTPAPATAPPAAIASRGRAGRMLLVDDEPEVRRVVREMAVALGFDVVEAGNGLEAVDRLSEAPDDFVVVLLDMTMPTMGGNEAMPRLRALRTDLPVVRMSGYAVQIDDGLDPHVGYLHKPFRLADLARALDAVVKDQGRS